jgi:hypothetical protein
VAHLISSLLTTTTVTSSAGSAQPVFTELLAAAVQRLGHAVGVEDQRVTGRQVEPLLLQDDLVERAQHDTVLVQFGDRAVRSVAPQRPVVSGVGVDQPARVELQHGVDRSREHLRLAVLQDELVGAHEGRRGAAATERSRADDRPTERHEERGGNALPRHVRDQQAEQRRLVGQIAEVMEVTEGDSSRACGQLSAPLRVAYISTASTTTLVIGRSCQWIFAPMTRDILSQ